MHDLLDAIRRCTEGHAEAGGHAHLLVPGLTAIRAVRPSGLEHAVSRPLVCLVVQGAKQVTTGARTVAFSAGESLLISADLPTVSQITRATAEVPYLSLALELDPALVADLVGEIDAAPVDAADPIQVRPTEPELADAALRLLRLLDRPAAAAVLAPQLVREMHYWVLAGRHGAAIRRLGPPDAPGRRVARAVALLRADYAQPLPVERLAAAAGMSPSSFHAHFKAVTSLSPLQFQKQLRLIEARRLMVAEGATAGAAAYAVGYESVPQFTREYGRMFGSPPARDVQAARAVAA